LARSVNKVVLLGRIGRDAELKFTPAGAALAKFSIATDRRVKDNQTGEWRDETDWHNVCAWQSENVANHLLKGKQIYLEGRLSTRMYEKDGEKRYVTEVVCGGSDIILLGGDKPAGSQEQPVSRPRGRTPAKPEPIDSGITDDDVPF
jgi:single-strand DNA-binding protein